MVIQVIILYFPPIYNPAGRGNFTFSSEKSALEIPGAFRGDLSQPPHCFQEPLHLLAGVEGGKTHPHGAGCLGSPRGMGQRSTVESRANRNPPLAQFLRHPAWVPAGHPEGEHAALTALPSR